jgi:alkylhydroperoxidase family enzyme
VTRLPALADEDLDPGDLAVLRHAVATNRMASDVYPRIVANHPSAFAAMIEGLSEDRGYHGPTLLGSRLCELIRLRSAQLGGCDECAKARYDPDGVSEHDITCVVADLDVGEFDERERLALRFMTLMHVDHHAIDDAMFEELRAVFTTAEIVELGQFCANWVGLHRWLHTLDLLDTGARNRTLDHPREAAT